MFADDDPMGKKIEEKPIPDDMKEQAETYRKALEEAIVESNDNLMEKYLEGATDFTVEELKVGLRNAVIANKVVPVLCGSA
ncbi:elongation factor G, partial [Acinetobacter baumannii]